MTISIRLNDADAQLIRKYAEMKGMSISELVRQSVIERIEDEFDLKVYEAALAEYKANPVTYTLDEVEKELELR
ncbi:MAG: Ribbon-helix-helix protein, copG family [Firmicutes bacterium ADurb.Bin099]|nr:MAG: Ribbon-helix-helix protein, copG family [Firmicutes bacterium ADurb.Bin099]